MKYYNVMAYEYIKPKNWILKYPESAKKWGFKQGYSWGVFLTFDGFSKLCSPGNPMAFQIE